MIYLIIFAGRLGISNFVIMHIKLRQLLKQQSRSEVALKRKGFDTMHMSMRVPLTPLKHVADATRLCKSYVSLVYAR